jgi:hypothetical protein
VLRVVSHLRQQNLPGRHTTVWKKNFWVGGLDYLHVARAALDCSAYFSAILYADIWCQNHREIRW